MDRPDPPRTTEASGERPGVDLRIVQANERTLLAWLRTSLGIMAFGFVVARLGLWLAQVQPGVGGPSSPSVGGSLWVGVGLVTFGSLTLVLAAVRYVRTHRAILAGREHVPDTTLAVVVAGVLAAGGVGLAAYLLSKS